MILLEQTLYKTKNKNIMAKNPNQLGATSIWDGPLSEVGRATAPGNSRNHMEVLKSPTPYKAGPISSKAKG
tara:strand:+ start:331 stop:543 length:213 start_codon:yes stop_codon:yes gene_type:complete